MNSDCFVFAEERDEFRMWQGLVGPHYTPAVDSLGNLSWTNNGNLVNPPTVNVSGRGLTITGIVDASTDLPETAPQYTCYLVGTTSPYHAYIFDGTSWTDLGIVGKGDKGDTGDDGFSPVVTVTTITGGHEVSIEDANGTQTFDVMDGQDGAPGEGVPSGGTDGQMLVKDGSADYATKWQNQPTIPSAYTSNPAMDGTASPGSSTAWAKGDHVHPHDTSKADTGLGITGATVGKVPVISAVDGNGVPTAFDAGDGGDVTADMLGIVITGNSTPVGASAGQYVIVKNSTISGITDGLYTAAQAIPANTAIDSTYLTAVSGGGLNSIASITPVTTLFDDTHRQIFYFTCPAIKLLFIYAQSDGVAYTASDHIDFVVTLPSSIVPVIGTSAITRKLGFVAVNIARGVTFRLMKDQIWDEGYIVVPYL